MFFQQAKLALLFICAQFLSQTSRLATRSTAGAVVLASSALFDPTSAEAACTVSPGDDGCDLGAENLDFMQTEGLREQ